MKALIIRKTYPPPVKYYYIFKENVKKKVINFCNIWIRNNF